jgi:hypothetical protein
MYPERREWLKRRYGYAEWAREEGSPPTEEFHGVRVEEGLLPGWRLEHADLVLVKPPETHAIFTRGESGNEQILPVIVWECDSTAAAHRFLIEVLNRFESARVERVAGLKAVGDVAFGHGEYVLLFARANLIVLVRNGGRNIVPVAGPARALEAGLTRRGRET